MSTVRSVMSLLQNSRPRMQVANSGGGAGVYWRNSTPRSRAFVRPRLSTIGLMASKREDSIPHELRTAAEPRQQGLYPVRLARVKQVNPSVRLLQFSIPAHKNPVCINERGNGCAEANGSYRMNRQNNFLLSSQANGWMFTSLLSLMRVASQLLQPQQMR